MCWETNLGSGEFSPEMGHGPRLPRNREIVVLVPGLAM
jgi:hypothetical protein